EKASADLARTGIRALSSLQKVMANPPSLEVRRRVKWLLIKLDPTELPPEDLLALRSVQALEYIASPEARQILERLSHTSSGRLTEEAALAIERLTRTGGPRP